MIFNNSSVIMMTSFIIKEETEELQSPTIMHPPFLINHMSHILDNVNS